MVSSRLRSAVPAPLRIASPASTSLPSIMKTALGMILFRNFWRKNGGGTDACSMERCHSEAPALLVRGICCAVAARSRFLRLPALRVGMTKVGERLPRRRRARATLDAHHDRFRFQPYAPDFLDALLDLIFQRKNFGGAGSAAVYDGK